MSNTVELRACEEGRRVAFYGRHEGGPWRLLGQTRHGRVELERAGLTLDELGVTSGDFSDLIVNAEHLRPAGRSPELVTVVERCRRQRRPVRPPSAGRVLAEVAIYAAVLYAVGSLACAGGWAAAGAF